jgi:carboxymethylenebutenolidase
VSEIITFKAKSGSDTTGYLALPPGENKAPGLILLQEWWGLNDHIKDLADRFAREGFLVIAPDLYHGVSTQDATEAGQLMTDLKFIDAVDEIEGAMATLRAHSRSNGKVAVTGFCMGGALTLASATAIEGLSAAVPFYGIPDLKAWDITKITAPILGHFATRDGWVPPAKAQAIKEQLDALGRSFELCVYDADHAFANDTRPAVYNADAAKLAWDRTISFLRHHGQPA